jgi:peroxiredoxin
MSLTPSTMLALGTKASDFTLLDTASGINKRLDQLSGKSATLIMFICNHCPFVIHVNDELVRLANDYKSQGLNCIAISSNSVETHPQDGPDKMTELAREKSFPFPYLYDQSQGVAKAYKAACTPDFFLFNKELELVYRGQLDDSRPSNEILVSGKDMRMALDQLLANESITVSQQASIGCNIKWYP